MKPWTFESKGIPNREWKNLKYVSNDNIKTFMKPEEYGKKLFLIGTKGCGKTLLLHKMAYEFFHNYRSNSEEDLAPHNVSDQLVEVLAFANIDPSDATLLALKDHNRWRDIWIMAIGLQFLRASGEDVHSSLQEIVDEFDGLMQVRFLVPHIINDYEELHFNRRIFRKNNRLMAALSGLRDRYVLFLDGLDQALSGFLTDQGEQYERLLEDDPNLMYTVWQSAQFGLLLACTDINKTHNRRLTVFATAREEAFGVADQMAINVKEFCTTLQYTDEELREIFCSNIERMERKHCFGNSKNSLEYRMFGCDEMAHLVPKNGNGELLTESGFELVLRHTYRRPREVVLLGSRLYSQFNIHLSGESQASEKYKHDVRLDVHENAHKDIFEQYTKEIFPTFRKDYLREFMQVAKSNVLTRREIQEIQPDVVNYLYSLGLLGYVNGEFQHFQPTVTLIESNQKKIPYSDYYLVHPSLDLMFQDRYSNEDFYNKRNIIGHGLRFWRPKRSLNTLIKNRSLEDFRPQQLPGKKANRWESARVLVEDPMELYRLIFFNTKSSRAESRLETVMKADHLLTLLLVRWGVRIVGEVYNRKQSILKGEIDDKIAQLEGYTMYETKITDYGDAALDHFAARLFGRLALVGVILTFDFDNETTKHLLKSFSVNDHGDIPTGKGAEYLRYAFFIAGLPENSHLNEHQASGIWYGLSKFEREFLSRWYHKSVNNDLRTGGNFSDEEYGYLHSRLGKTLMARMVSNNNDD